LKTHEDYRREVTVKRSSDRSFGFWMAVILIVIALLPVKRGHPIYPWFLAAGILIGLIAWAQPRLLHYPNLVWSGFGLLLGRIMQPVVMTILFFVLFTPVGFIRRFFQKSSMRDFRDGPRDSYWIARVPPGPNPDTMRDQF
jgi:hypothetical protein